MRKLLKGTKILFGGSVLTVQENVNVTFEGDQSEGRFAAILLQEGDAAFDANKRQLRLLYNRTNGALLPLEDQQKLTKKDWGKLTSDERRQLGITDEMLESATPASKKKAPAKTKASTKTGK